MNRCLATLVDLPEEGLHRSAQHAMAGGRRRFPHRVAYTRAQLVTYRAEHARSMSISGFQDKISMRLQRGALEPTDTGGRYILKPIPRTDLTRFIGDVPANEQVCMRMARVLFGIETAEQCLVRMADGELAYVTRRFDYDGERKLLQEDFCQIMNRSSESHGARYKYECSYEEAGELIRRYCPTASVQLPRFLRLLLFSYLIGNGDLHLKNLSLIETGDGDFVLTPAYDLLSSTLHLPDEARLAMDLVDDEAKESAAFVTNGFVTGSCFIELGQRLGVAAPITARELARIARLQGEAEALVGRSFLSPAAQQGLIAIMRDRQQALAIA